MPDPRRSTPSLVLPSGAPLSLSHALAQPKTLIRALMGETQAQPTFWFMRQAGRYLPEYRDLRAKAGDFLSLCLTPALAAEVTLQPIRRFGMDAAILFSDILMVPLALGRELEFRDGEGPVLEPLDAKADMPALEARLASIDRVLEPVYETVTRVAEALPLDTALIGFCGAPWTVACYMVDGGSSRDFARTRRLAYAEPEVFQRLIDVLSEASGRYLERQIAAGAEIVQIFDTWAGLLPEDEFRRWCVEPTRRIVAKLRQSHASVPIIAFPRGVGIGYLEMAAETGVDALGLDPTVPLDWAARMLQGEVALQGNLDPLLLVVGGVAMEQGAARILRALGRGPFVFNLGHGIVPETPPAHVSQLCQFIRHWRAGG